MVTANHFDIDALVSVFTAMSHPYIEAPTFFNKLFSSPPVQSFPLKYEAILRQISKIGDFRELDPSNPTAVEAMKVCCWINTVEKREFYRPFDGDEREGSKVKFEYFLPKFAEVIINPEQYRVDWEEEYNLVMAGLKQLNDPSLTQIHQFPEIKLIIIETSEPVHYYALFSLTEGYDTVLSIYSGNRYELEYKYTAYIDLISRPVFPRVDPTKLIEKLNNLEIAANNGTTSKAIWGGNRIVDSGPIIRLDKKGIKLDKVQRYGHPYERPIYESKIDKETLKRIVSGYFRFAYQGMEPKSLWQWQQIHQFNRKINWEQWVDEE